MAKSKRTRKPVPTFANESDERRFWETHDTMDYVDWSAARVLRFPNLKPSTESISLRLPAGLLVDLKAVANMQDVPYQSLLKMFLADRVAREWRAKRLVSARAHKALPPASRGKRKAESTVRARATRG